MLTLNQFLHNSGLVDCDLLLNISRCCSYILDLFLRCYFQFLKIEIKASYLLNAPPFVAKF